MIEYDAQKVGRLLDTNGLIGLHQGTSTKVLVVLISDLSKAQAEAVKEYCKCGICKPQIREFYSFVVNAQLAMDVLNRVGKYSKWQTRQIRVARAYQGLKREVIRNGLSLGADEIEYGNELCERMNQLNDQLREKQKQYRINRMKKLAAAREQS